MNNIVFIKRTSAIFLAIVLVLGTIALAVPSFMITAQATSDREKDYDNDEEKKSYDKDRDDESRDNDKDYDDDDEEKSYGKDSRDYDENNYDKDEDKKSYDKDNYDSKFSYYKDDYKSEYSSYGKDKSKDSSSSSVSIKKIKCNNINVNLNGIDANIGGLPINGPVTDPVALAQEVEDDDDEESNSIESNDYESFEGRDGKSDSDTNSSIVCINNNNNIVVQEEPVPPVPPVPPVDECILCFDETTPEVRDAVIDALEAEGPLVIVPGVYEVPDTVITIEELCEWLVENGPLFLTQEQIENLIDSFIDANPGLSRADVEELVQCLIDAEIIIVVPPEPTGGCADCFTTIPNDGPWPPGLLNQFIDFLEEETPTVGGVTVTNIQQLCTALLNADPEVTTSEFRELLEEALPGNANKNTINAVIACLIATGDLVVG
ncbi:MAG: hypothetical protein AB7F53_04580 [Nitrososphaeraceae archaeon]